MSDDIGAEMEIELSSFAKESEVSEDAKDTQQERSSQMKYFFGETKLNSKEIYPWANVVLISGVIGSIEYIPVLFFRLGNTVATLLARYTPRRLWSLRSSSLSHRNKRWPDTSRCDGVRTFSGS